MKLKLLLQFLFLAQIITAQTFTEVAQMPPFDGVELSSIAFADVDGDGDNDVLITGLSSSLSRIAKLYTNDGEGTFTEVMDTPFEGVTGAIAFADVDGDNDQDVLIAGQTLFGNRIANLYINDGEGTFSESLDTPFDGIQSGSVAIADVDGDGDNDILITGLNNDLVLIAKLYINDGTGAFSEVSDTPFAKVRASAIAFADVDGDGDNDVLITGRNNSLIPISKLYINDGTGIFSEAVGNTFDGIESGNIAFADVDGDNDKDVLITGVNLGGNPISKLYVNNGGGTFSESNGTSFVGVQWGAVAFTDVDGDVDNDLLLTGRQGPGVRIAKLYTNDGTGAFSEVANIPFDGVQSGSVAFADVDGDNDQDVLITGLSGSSERIAKLYINGLVSSTKQLKSDFDLEFMPYPNPTVADKINIIYNSAKNSIATLKIYGPDGILVIQQETKIIAGQQFIPMDITSLAQGSYFVQLEDGQKRGVAKFIVH